MSFALYTVMILLSLAAILLILLILIQKGRGGGLSSSFGGGGGSTAFGAKTGDVLTWATAIGFGIFLLLGVTLDLLVDHKYASLPPAGTSQSLPISSSTSAPPVNTAPVAPAATAPSTPATNPASAVSALQQFVHTTTEAAAPTTNAINQAVQTGKTDAKNLLNPTTQPTGH